VIKGKSELYDFLSQTNKTVFVNLDDALQNQKTTSTNRYTFSKSSNNCNVKIDHIEANPMVTIAFNGITIQSQLIGEYNATNIIAAVTIGKYFKVDDNAIKTAIENYIPENNRSQLIQKNGNEIILDAYNANPSSMSAAIANFIQLHHSHKIAILGDMFELGTESLLEHKKIIDLVTNESSITTYFIGKDFFANQVVLPHIKFFENFESFTSSLSSNPPTNSLLLIKGSRGLALEKTLDFI
jgi:UDP-N-acetylmuramoyl-tripeptide--D-alanyl-D-alanine ligase